MKTKSTSIFLALVLFTILSIRTNAQVTIGPAAGINFSTIAGDNSSDNAMKLGFHFGADVDFAISDNIHVAPSLLYSIKGDQSSANSKFKANLNYLDIPILLKYKMESGLNFFVGPYVGILMSAKVTDGTNTTDIKDHVKSTDFGLKVGVGYDLSSGLGFNVHYELGLANINKDSGAGSNTNGLFGVTVHYMLGGK